ncbi:MAG: phenylalanine--tRNA ligase subunit beta [Clostridia bacterium]|nr:phenylalanine--tRNA ligase subunit beta [Clostridia bacterium]
MVLSMKWLSDYVKVDASPKDFSDRMTATGSKVEGFEDLGEKIKNVVVGKILQIEKHPDSDHLQICQIDLGEEAPVQIITGAQNISVGDLVPVAKHDSYLPDGTHIKAGKLRGLPSNGILCSLGELGLTAHDFPYADEDGIFILNEECTIGQDIKEVLDLNDVVVEFEITPNRPDCLSVIGLAREAAASYNTPLKLDAPKVKGAGDGDKIENYVSVEVLDTELCPRYTARVVKNIKIGPSPKWLRTRLRNSGIRPINNIVDITNYVCLEYGQPMHAFDHSFLAGGKIVVRRAGENEKITTLDDVERQLNDKMLVIADAEKAVGIAGVMGGQNSEINENTKTIVFESANFYGPSIRTTARGVGLRTEASGRYEKGLDPENTLPAIERACELIEMLGAGDVVDGIIDIYGKKQPQAEIAFDADKINKFLGTDIPEQFMLDTFKLLDIEYKNGKLYPPSFRADLLCMQDIAEEVVRIYGYNTIESSKFVAESLVGKRDDKQRYLADINTLLVAQGLFEVRTYSFISPKYYEKINLPEAKRASVVISNPLGEDTSIMRTTALPGVLEALSTNRRKRTDVCGLYEMAKVYIPVEGKDLPDETMTTVIACYGMGDFYNVKGYVEEILSMSGIKKYDVCSEKNNPTYHPGRCANFTKDDKVIATIGQLHPEVLEKYGFDLPVYAAEINTEYLLSIKNTVREYKPLPKFPAITRDLAFICEKSLEAGTLRRAIAKYAGNLLENVTIFDVYTDAKLGDKKSMAYSLVLRSPDKTLSDEDGDKVVKKVLSGLEREFGITLRS